ncbi:MAG: SRPBCC family protein [Bacteroidota bacterium]
MNTTKITVQALIKADIRKVWDYYTKPEHITKWNFAIDTWHCPSASNDLRVGGKYVARMEAKDSSFGFDFEGIYNQVTEHKGFTFTMPDNRVVKVTFNDKGSETEVVVTFDAENQNPIEMQQQGWQAILNNFKSYVESQP